MRLDGEYQVVEVLHIGKHTQVLKCNYQDSNVVVKTHIDEFASPSVIRQLKREFLIGTQACKNAKRIIRHVRLVETENTETEKTIAILVEDIGARSLASAIPTNGFTLNQFLHIAIECIKGVREIHTRNIIHKDVKPANMVY
jgi:serine/threonine protein kinase